MTALALALSLFMWSQSDLDAGLVAFRAGRYEEAAATLAAATTATPSYEGLIALGVSLGRLERQKEARQAFDRALALDPQRPQAFVERGGLSFLERDYGNAVRDLERALALHDDAYARELLASSLYLEGRTDDALAQWNRLGQPSLRTLDVVGLVHTRDRIVRREIALEEGSVLDLDRLRRSRRQLAELGIFDRVTLRPVPREQGKADLEAALIERHGFYKGTLDFVVSTAVNAIGRRVGARYSNLGGAAVSFGGEYRWNTNRPELSLSLDVPRPFGLPAYTHLRAFRGRQNYELDGRFTRRSKGLDLDLRHVVDGRTVVALGARGRDRTFSRPEPFAPRGFISGLEAALERRLVENRAQRLDVIASAFRALPALGSDLSYTQTTLTVAYHRQLSPRDERGGLETSELAAQVHWGWGSRGLPIDEMFVPGGSAEMDYPLRGHHQMHHGILGESPIARSLQLGNLEWRRRLAQWGELQLGSVLFIDAARVARAVNSADRALVDVGVGLRVGVRGAPVIRVDFGHGLSDGKNALFVGLGQTF
jgi:tetratricopeptide (TPR) repeat protein